LVTLKNVTDTSNAAIRVFINSTPGDFGHFDAELRPSKRNVKGLM
jgi:hypothetical protein